MTSPVQSAVVDAALVNTLLALPTAAQQLHQLQRAGLADRDGLLALVDYAGQLARADPGLARRLATVCAEVATQAGVAEAVPPAQYLKAQTHALAGEFSQALSLISAARNGFLALGQELSAMRTTAGLMHVLAESGHFQDALVAGQDVIDRIGATDESSLLDVLAVIQMNMGMCFNYIGQYDSALAAYEASESLYRGLGNSQRAGDVCNNRGILLWEMGRGSEALAALDQALAIRVDTGQSMLQAQTLSNIGSVRLLLGHYTASLESFEAARRIFSSLDALVDQHVLLLDTANAYLTLNLYDEAVSAYQEAAELLSAAGVIRQRARALWGLGATLVALGRADEAETVLAEAVSALGDPAPAAGAAAAGAAAPSAERSTPLLASILLEQAAAQAAGHNFHPAQTTAEQVLELARGRDWPIPSIYAHLQLADLAQEDWDQVEPHLMATRQLMGPLHLPHLQYRLHQRLGRMRRRQGRLDEARTLLEEAAAAIESLRGTLAQETLRSSFLHDKVAAFDELALLYLSQGDEAGDRQAFFVAERAKSRTLLDLISGVLEAAPDGEESAAAQRGQLQADLNAVYNELLNPAGPDQTQGRSQMLQARAAELEAAITQLQLRGLRRDEGGEQWAIPLSLDAIQEQLPADTVLLVYHIIEEEILAFVVTSAELRVFRSLGSAPNVQAGLRRLTGLLDRLRAGSFYSADQISLMERSARRVLYGLYELLVAPLAPYLADATSPAVPGAPPKLTIVPHGGLHQAPFHALFDGERYLIDQYEIVYAPSAAIYHLCQSRPQPEAAIRNPLLVGVSDPSIPAVKEEIEAVAAHLPQARVLLDEQATQANFQAAVPGSDLLHLACHGLFRAGNPMFSALRLHDGWLTAGEAMRLSLPNTLVTLSACESGRSRIAGGDELLGLLRAFLGAGAAALVVSLWLVQDQSTARLMDFWYDSLSERGSRPAEALRAAQLALRKEYPHPYHWAPFIMVGRR